MKTTTAMHGSATFSEDGVYRYELRRQWNPFQPFAMFIGLNPSTADASTDDPTIRRCCGFARSWQCGGIIMTNLFAYRATDPLELFGVADPVGPLNDDHIMAAAEEVRKIIVCCWGNHGALQQRDLDVPRLVGQYPLQCFGMTKTGQPKHPLYLPANTILSPFARFHS